MNTTEPAITMENTRCIQMEMPAISMATVSIFRTEMWESVIGDVVYYQSGGYSVDHGDVTYYYDKNGQETGKCIRTAGSSSYYGECGPHTADV